MRKINLPRAQLPKQMPKRGMRRATVPLQAWPSKLSKVEAWLSKNGAFLAIQLLAFQFLAVQV